MLEDGIVQSISEAENFVKEFRTRKSQSLIIAPLLIFPEGRIRLGLAMEGSVLSRIFPVDREIFSPLAEIFEDKEIQKVGVHLVDIYCAIRHSLGVAMAGMFDLEIADRLLLAGLELDHSHEGLLKRRLNKGLPEDAQGWFHTTIELLDQVRTEIKSKELEKVWQIERNAQPAFCEMHYQGMKLSRPKWIKLMQKNQAEMQKAQAELLDFLGPICQRSEEGRPLINLDSPQQVLGALREMQMRTPDGKLIEATDKSTLLTISHLPPIQSLLRYRAAEFGFTRFGHNYLDACDKDDRIHFNVNQNGTASGRPTTFNKLNCLNTPKKGGYREAFVAGEGKKLTKADYNAIELRILAQGSQDPAMLEVFNSGKDYHQSFASDMFGRPVERHDPLRDGVKKVAYGIPYGQSVRGVHLELCEQGYAGTLQDTQELYTKYAVKVPRMIAFLNAVGSLAIRDRYLRNNNGRLRYWAGPVEGQRQEYWENAVRRSAASFPGQSTNADFMKVAIARIWQEILDRKWLGRVWMSNMRFDDLLLEADDCLADEAYSLQCKHMTEAAQEMLPSVPIVLIGGIL